MSSLEELDLGWCLKYENRVNVTDMVRCLPRLKKLFLSSYR